MTMDGVKAEFQIIDLENMNIKDANGATHHVMVKFFNAYTHDQLKDGSGKIKVIAPSKETSVASIRNYKGIYAAYFKFTKPGKYRVVCHAKVDEKNFMDNFWYNYHE